MIHVGIKNKMRINPTTDSQNTNSLNPQLCKDFESILQINNIDRDDSDDNKDVAVKDNDELLQIKDSKPISQTPSTKNKYYDATSADIHSDSDKCGAVRKPHFLDDDYHLKSSDHCQILKPHFLDQSLSPDDDKVINVLDPENFTGPGKSNLGMKKLENARYQNGNNDEIKFHKEMYGFSDFRIDESRNLEECSQDKNEHYPNAMMSSHASNSSRYSHGFESGCFTERDMWQNQDSCSVKSFFSAGSENVVKMENSRQQQIGSKVDCVYSLLSLLSLSTDCNTDMSEYLLEMSKTIDSCIAMRQSGCIPLLVQLIHSKHSRVSKNKAAQALHNMIHIQPEDKSGRREVRVLRLLEQVRDYCYVLEDYVIARKENNADIKDDMGKHPVQSVAALMKLSFDEEHRHVMCQLGGLQSLASLVTVDQAAHGSAIEDIQCITMRKYSGMALTNLTFGDGNNKALLCSFKEFMTSLVEQLQSPNDDMRQVTAAVLRNLSWRADSASKQILRDVGAVKGLTLAAMTGHKEATLKSVLSALWNLTAHCSLNKADICSVEGALAFLVKMLSFDAPSKTLAIIENAGGILRNVSSHIAIREDYRIILREHSCLKILLQQLKSPSLTIVSNSCGTLWNLSARSLEDQQFLWDHGAVPMLRSLIHSKHKMIAMGSSAALKNLLNSTPGKNHIKALDSTARDLNLPLLPTLGARKQKALEQELDQNLSETCENIEPNTSPTTSNRDEKLLLSAAEKHLAISIEKRKMSTSSPLIGHLSSQMSLSHSVNFGNFQNSVNTLQNSISKGIILKSVKSGIVNRSESKDSIASTHSDSVYEMGCRNDKLPIFSENSPKNPDCSSINAALTKVDLDFIKQCTRTRNIMKYDCSNIPISKNVNISRNNYSESGYDIESEGCDQPIDYSQKYCETKSTTAAGNNFSLSDSYQKSKDTANVANRSHSPLFHIKPEMNGRQNNEKPSEDASAVVPFGDYQETDLDQPTDYSLRYAEDTSDAVSTISEPQIISVHEDTIKHFCTEGTPYETPINFSTATSMSDLRAIGRVQPDPSNIKENKISDPSLADKENTDVMAQSDERDTCSLEDIAKHNNDEALNDSRIIIVENKNVTKSAISPFSSGIASPEKPINYCEEGTPGYFSRVSSLSSLGEIGEEMIIENVWNPETPNASGKQFLTSSTSKNLTNVAAEEMHDSKAEHHENATNNINYAEETPLMFSRSSSLDSLSECSVPDQADDVRSVVSEFSRLTSGCISPSELPDSPTQSPLPRIEETGNTSNRVTKQYKLPSQTNSRLHSVFEDEVSTFKFECTPIEFSTGTSLSSLTIDDDPTEKLQIGKRHKPNLKPPSVETNKALQNIVKNGAFQTQSKSNIGNDKSTRSANILHKKEDALDSEITGDVCHTYCTEDTPAILSKVGSQSDLSIISIPETENNMTLSRRVADINGDISISIKREFSDDSSNVSGDSDHLLAECIESGMPKRKIPTYYLPQDELENYAVEGSPFRHSAHSSLSDLTIGSHNTEHKARLVKNLEPESPGNRLLQSNGFVPFKQSPQRQGSLTGSLSSVSLESDDEHFLEMAIRAGVPKKIGDKMDAVFRNGSEFRKVEKKMELAGEIVHVDVAHYNLDDKSEEHITVLNRNDSLSSLSVDSLGSNEGERALFEQCIKSGMPKVSRPVPNWEGVHAKTLDKNFKARSSYRNKTDLLDNLDESLNKTDINHDTVFENLVTAGAFATCSRKHSKTEENLSDKTLLEEAIYCGMPKKRDKTDKEPIESRFEKMKIHSDQCEKNTTVSDCSNLQNNLILDIHSKNVQATSVVAHNIPMMLLPSASITTADVKKAADLENIIESIEKNAQPNPFPLPMVRMEKDSLSNEQTIPKASEKNHRSSGATSSNLQSNSTVKNGSESTAEDQSRKYSVPESDSIEDLTMMESIAADRDTCDSTVKLDKDITDSWNESSDPLDVSFQTASGSLPILTTFKSDNLDEITSVVGLPDLMEESMIISENENSPKFPNCEDKLFNEEFNPTGDLVESQLFSLKMSDSLKNSSVGNSAIIEKEAARLAAMIKNNDFSYCLTDNEVSMGSLDLDNVDPPSRMGSLVSMSHSLVGNYDECHSENSDCDKLNNMLKLSIENNFKKKSSKKAFCLARDNFDQIENNSFNNLENIKPPSEMDDMIDMENSMLSVASIVSEVADMRGDELGMKQSIDSSVYTFSNLNNRSTEFEYGKGFNLLGKLTLGDSNNQSNFTSNTALGKSENDVVDLNFAENKTNKNSLTPKQKRQLVKERYKTYTIDGNILFKSNCNDNVPSHSADLDLAENENDSNLIVEASDVVNESDTKNTITKVEFKLKKTIKQRRMENSERFRTQTIDRSINSSPDTPSNDKLLHESTKSETSYRSENEAMGASESFNSQIVHDATKAFEFLQKHPVEDSSYVDLECETMSLISEDDSELNSFRLKTLSKSFKNYLPVIESPTAVDKCVEMNLKNMDMESTYQMNQNHDPDDVADEKHTSDLNSSECEQNSETESADQNHYIDSETELPREKPKPVISKPKSLNSCESLDADDPNAKGIRGRRKGVYVSPYKRNELPSKKPPSKTNSSVKLTKGNVTLKASHNLTTKATYDSKRTNGIVSKNSLNVAKMNEKMRNIEKLTRTMKYNVSETKTSYLTKSNSPPKLVRQGTFTKEESVFPNSECGKNNNNTPVKNITPNVSTSKLPQPSSRSATIKTSSAESNISGEKSCVRTNLKKPNIKSYSSSNRSLQSNDSCKTVKSNVKTVSIGAIDPSSKTLIKDTASKVANLWKRVEQNRTGSKPNAKTWIAKDSDVTPESSADSGSVPGKAKLIRSSTFECSPKTSSTIPVPLKQKSSITIRDSKLNNYKYNSKVPIVKSSSKY